MSPSRTLGVIAAMAVLTFGLVSCTPEPAPVPSATPSASPSLAPLPAGDRVLRLGTLLPTTGTSAFLAPAQAAGVELAVREINEAGGVLGAPIEVFHRNSGDASGDVLEKSFGELLAKKVDVVIGPSSSVLAARLLPKSEAAGVPLISPAAIAPDSPRRPVPAGSTAPSPPPRCRAAPWPPSWGRPPPSRSRSSPSMTRPPPR